MDDFCSANPFLFFVQNQIGDKGVFQKGDVGKFVELGDERPHDFFARQVGGVQNAAEAVSAF